MNKTTDPRGVPVTSHSSAATAGYERALVQSLSYVGDPVATMQETLAAHPEFPLGHILIAGLALMMTERGELALAAEHIKSAEAMMDDATDRERRLLAAVTKMHAGDWLAASRAWDALLTDYPRDALALQLGHLTDFYCGDSGNLRDRVARAICHWDADTPGYSYVLGMYAFGLEECNEFARAEECARAALDLEACDCWAVHALAHVCEMQGRYGEGMKMYRERLVDWTKDNSFRYHNWWHLALYHLEDEDFAAALQVYDDEILPAHCAVALQLCDASALLWRLQLHEVDVADRWSRLAAMWYEKLPTERGYYAFNDMHAMMAFAYAGRDAECRDLLAAVTVSANGDGTNAMMSAVVGLPACEAMLAFREARYDDAIARLLPLRPLAARFGGSNAQRDVLTQTLLEAAIRGGRKTLAQSILGERKMHKIDTPLSRRFMHKLAA